MSIFSRLTDIVNANLNSLLDRAEDPEKMIRLMVQEMEDTLVEVRASAARGIADKKDIERKLTRAESAQDEWERKAELALSKDRDDLAKGALLEKAKLEETAGYLSQELGHLAEAFQKHEVDIQQLEQKLREARAKQKSLTTRVATAESSLRVRERLQDYRVEDAFERFEKMERRIDMVEAETEAYDVGHARSLDDEILDLERDEAIEAELEALKSKVAGEKKPAATKAKAKVGTKEADAGE